ncbi:formate dehydrogenase [Mesorhizobium sp. NBSH29]|uniref:formate dehydrogenase subunit delta n=1 Tax=Mesorhizobium sp. NBSH29 TaxID=2654249 RepID=UPI0018969F0F|nr:formate dehydrogenase subunit delta [Mesorhizobium sp. NBSH29]QPC86700.1 formate dehydrogenase [Mesorhizobium sp. NBSH29]
MSHDEMHRASTAEKLVRMANQIATFFLSKPHEQGVAGVAEHINKFWDPRMRRQFFELIEAGGEGFLPLVIEAVPGIRAPNAPEQGGVGGGDEANAGAPGGKGTAAGEAKAEIAATQG